MTGKFLLGWLLTTLFSCSIISDDHLDKLPDDVRVREVEIAYDKWVGDTYEYKGLRCQLVFTGNKIEMSWPEGAEFLFLDKQLRKTTFLLNAAGFAEKITSVFDDGTEIIDDLKYNSNNQVIELSNSFFKDNLKLFYKANIIDSVAKTRALANNTTQFGFYKQVEAEKMISIFPFDNTKSYSKSTTFSGTCSSGGSIPTNNNDFYKTVYTSWTIYDPGYPINENYQIDYQQRVNNMYCKDYLGIALTNYNNYFGKPYDTGLSLAECSSCGPSNTGYFNIFMLIPELVPDNGLLYLLTAENEIKWVKNNPKAATEWTIRSISYKYKPLIK